MQELLEELKQRFEDDKSCSPEDRILLEQLEFVLNCMNEAKYRIETETLMENVTRDKDKDPYYRPNIYINVYGGFFTQALQLYKALHLTRDQKEKLKQVRSEKSNSINDLKDKYSRD